MAFRAGNIIVLTILWLVMVGVGPSPGQGGSRTPAADFPVATGVRVGGDDAFTRFVMDFSRKVELRTFTLSDPYRVVIDLPQVTFGLSPNVGDSGRGLVKAFRFGLVMQGGSRIVLDVNKPVRIERAFAIEATAGQPARLVVDLASTDRASFLRTQAADNPPHRAAVSNGSERNSRAAGQSADPRPVVVIDPGHGGIDNGTVATSGVMEKSIVLDFALVLRDQLEASGKYRVVMTRTDDSFIPLSDRVRMARVRQAALLISIHVDALRKGDGEASGATVYTLSETASDGDAAKAAENENRADLIAGIDLSQEPDDVADILLDLAQRETKALSTQFAKSLVTDMRKVARMHKNPLKSAGFRVLRAPDVPSVLVELGYVSSRSDLNQLTSNSWQVKTASAVVRATDAFLSTRTVGNVPAGSRGNIKR